MTHPLKLLFDECCSKRLPRDLQSLYPDIQTRHVLDNYSPSTADSVWLELLRNDKSWLVVTKDLGRDPKKERLHLICREWKITHLAFTAALISAGGEAHKNALISVWSQLSLLQTLPGGTRVKLGFGKMKAGVQTHVLIIASQTFQPTENSILSSAFQMRTLQPRGI